MKELIDNRITIEQLLVLDSLYNGLYELLDIYDDDFSNEKALSIYLSLERRGLIVKDPNMVTHYIISMDGKELFERLLLVSNGVTIDKNNNISHKRKTKQEKFEEWWNLYPLHSKWKDERTGKTFSELRGLRLDKSKCKIKYDSIINSGVVTHQELLDCLRYEIKSRKIESIKTSSNKLAFMKGSYSYLNQSAWDIYLDLVKKDPDFISSMKNSNGNNDIDILEEDCNEGFSSTELI